MCCWCRAGRAHSFGANTGVPVVSVNSPDPAIRGGPGNPYASMRNHENEEQFNKYGHPDRPYTHSPSDNEATLHKHAHATHQTPPASERTLWALGHACGTNRTICCLHAHVIPNRCQSLRGASQSPDQPNMHVRNFDESVAPWQRCYAVLRTGLSSTSCKGCACDAHIICRSRLCASGKATAEMDRIAPASPGCPALLLRLPTPCTHTATLDACLHRITISTMSHNSQQ